MAEVQPLTDADIAAIEYDAKRGALSLPLLWGRALETIRLRTEAAEYSTQRWEVASQKWAEALRQRDEALAERDKWRQIAYDQAMLLLASYDDWMSRNVDALNVQMEQYRDEAIALLADVEAYFHNGIDLNDLISYALRRATNPGA